MLLTLLISSALANTPAYNLICKTSFTELDMHTRTTKEVLYKGTSLSGVKLKLYVANIYSLNKSVDYLEVSVNNKVARYPAKCWVKP